MPLSKSVALILVAVLTFLSNTSYCTARLQKPLKRIIFTPWDNVPARWTKYDLANTSLSNPKLTNTKSRLKEFKHALFASELSYVFAVQEPGQYVLRIGSIEKLNCTVGKRAFSYSVNGVQVPVFSVSNRVGCATPYFTDVSFLVADDLLVSLSFLSLSDRWLTSISNFQLFAGSHLHDPNDSADLQRVSSEGVQLIPSPMSADSNPVSEQALIPLTPSILPSISSIPSKSGQPSPETTAANDPGFRSTISICAKLRISLPAGNFRGDYDCLSFNI